MENSSKKNDLNYKVSSSQSGDFENEQKKDFYSPKAVNSSMTELTIPPAHVWDKIEQILDEQDERRRRANEIIVSSFKNKKKRSQLYVCAFCGISLIVGFIWFLR